MWCLCGFRKYITRVASVKKPNETRFDNIYDMYKKNTLNNTHAVTNMCILSVNYPGIWHVPLYELSLHTAMYLVCLAGASYTFKKTVF